MKYLCIDAYKEVEKPDEWLPCPACGLVPREWIFDNGRQTACGCGKTRYDHFSIFAESIMSVHKRTKKTAEYDIDELRNNWNHWVKTGEIVFEFAGKRSDGRW